MTRTTSVRLPAATLTESNLSGTTPVKGGTAVSAVSTRKPIQEMPLGSVAWTVMLSLTSTRAAMLCDTTGGVRSFAADWTVNVTGGLEKQGRPPASTAKAVTSKVPVEAST